jgi:tight adherence protein B
MNLLDALFVDANPGMSAVPIGFMIVALVSSALILASPSGAASRRLRRRIDRLRLGAGVERAKRDLGGMGSVRRQPTKTLLGQAGRDLIRVLPHSEALCRRLEQAGIRLNVVDYALLCGAAGLGAAALLHLLYAPPWSVTAGVGIVAATGAPHLLLERRIKNRRRQFLSQFPDAIDLIVRGVRSGLPVAEALQTAGQELPNQVGAVFQEVTGNIKLGKNLDEALKLASRGLEAQELKFFMISLTIQQETGGNLGEILHNLGILMRRREQMKLKIKAMSSEGRASAMIIGSLPFVMFFLICLIGPDYVMKLFTDPRGWLLLGGGFSSLGLGLGVMAKMIRFEI